MFHFYVLWPLALVTFAATGVCAIGQDTGNSVGSLAMNLYMSEHPGHIVGNDNVRVQAIQTGSPLPVVDITNVAFGYTIDIGVGDPAYNYTLFVDTGSSNTWVGANQTYVRTNTSRDTGHHFGAAYGSGSVTGEEYIDTVTLSPELVITQQSIGVAKNSTGFTGLDGLAGFGPVRLTNNTVSGVHTVPTVMDNLYSQGTIRQEALGVYLTPSCESNTTGGLSFGGVDNSVIIGPVEYAPLITTGHASYYWGVSLSIDYGEDRILSSGSGILDTGTTLMYISHNAFQVYKAKTGAVYDPNSGFYMITPEQYDELEPLVLNIGGNPFPLSANAQIWPRPLNILINGDPDGIYLSINDLGRDSDIPFNALIGYTFLQRYYSLYDTTNQRVGLARTAYTDCGCN